tara:strand:+ start:33020 stop:34234 length:1215 start_codon:yes stop_codon:yes gene_type:complete
MIFMLLISLTPILSIHFPRFLAFWPLLIGLGMSAWIIFKHKEKLALSKTYFLSAGILSILFIASAAWSIAPADAFEDAMKTSALLLFGGLFISLCKTLDLNIVKPYFWLFPVSVIIAALICTFDLATDMSLYRILHHKTETDIFNSSVMNRGVVCTVLSYFIALIFIKDMDAKHKYLLLGGLTVSVLAMLALTQSQSGQLAFGVGLALALIFPQRYRISYYLLGGGIILGMFLTPYIVSILFADLIGHAEETSWLQDAFVGNRLEIWDFVIKYAMHNPLLGYGIEATRYVPAFEHDYLYHKEATILHPHNFAVQIWMEFGLLGTLICATIMGLFVKHISLIDNQTTKRAVTSLFIITLLFASMTYGLWQGWWLGEFIFIMGICVSLSKNPITAPSENLTTQTTK